ncbi:MAG: hypothetical protein ACE5FG_09705 [Myxococcota bacterium]
MSRSELLLLLLVAVLLVPQPVRAKSEIEGLREQVAELRRLQQQTRAELDELRARVRAESREPPPVSAGGEAELDLEALAGEEARPSIDFHGHLAAAYFGFEEANVNPGVPGSPSLTDLSPLSSFSLTDLTFFVGVPLSEALYVATEVEYELGGESVEIDQAFIHWDLQPEERLALRLGKFYVPFGIERFYQNAPQNPLVDRPSPYIHIIPGTYSETGIELRGERSLLDAPELVGELEIALVNGPGAALFDLARDARQNRDNNSSKTVAGRLGFRYDRWLRAGFSYMQGEYDDGDEDDFYAIGADLRASGGGFQLRGEYVFSGIDRPEAIDANGKPCSDTQPLCPGFAGPLPSTLLGGSLHRRGWYLEGSYRHSLADHLLLHDVQYVTRFDVLDEDDSLLDLLDARRLALGLVIRPMDHLRLKLQYEITDEDTREFDNNAFLLEGSVDW